MPLSTLLNDTAALLNDQNFLFTSQAQMTRWINEARRQIAVRTGCCRRLITGQSAFGASSQPGYAIPGAMQPGMIPNANPQSASPVTGAVVSPNMQTIVGVERYPFAGFFNPYLQQMYAGADRVLDPIALSINWGGPSRPSLDWLPWDEFQAYCRAYAYMNMAYPSVWSVFDDGPNGEIWIFPTPSQALDMELDCTVLPKAIYTDDDPDIIPDAWQNAIKFHAASLTAASRQQFSIAEIYGEQFKERLGISRAGVDRGKSRSYYF